jgi:Domain of unknown function (DUF1707)
MTRDLPSSDLRVGDAERSAVVERLSAHAAAGRLTVEELEERVAAAHAAVHARDLERLERDLPAPRRRSGRAIRPAFALGGPAALYGVIAALIALGVALSVLAGHPIPPPFVVAFVLWRVAAFRGVLRTHT